MLGMIQLKGTGQTPSCSGERKETHLSMWLGQADPGGAKRALTEGGRLYGVYDFALFLAG